MSLSIPFEPLNGVLVVLASLDLSGLGGVQSHDHHSLKCDRIGLAVNAFEDRNSEHAHNEHTTRSSETAIPDSVNFDGSSYASRSFSVLRRRPSSSIVVDMKSKRTARDIIMLRCLLCCIL